MKRNINKLIKYRNHTAKTIDDTWDNVDWWAQRFNDKRNEQETALRNVFEACRVGDSSTLHIEAEKLKYLARACMTAADEVAALAHFLEYPQFYPAELDD